jgi:hypothetical protein
MQSRLNHKRGEVGEKGEPASVGISRGGSPDHERGETSEHRETAGAGTPTMTRRSNGTAYPNEPPCHPDPFGAAQGMLREGSRCTALNVLDAMPQ